MLVLAGRIYKNRNTSNLVLVVDFAVNPDTDEEMIIYQDAAKKSFKEVLPKPEFKSKYCDLAGIL